MMKRNYDATRTICFIIISNGIVSEKEIPAILIHVMCVNLVDFIL